MNTSYTRQRQGRDFPAPADEAVKADSQKRDFLRTIERHKKEAERNAVPVDGREPDGITPEKER
jgi:hypothetical protein